MANGRLRALCGVMLGLAGCSLTPFELSGPSENRGSSLVGRNSVGISEGGDYAVLLEGGFFGPSGEFDVSLFDASACDAAFAVLQEMLEQDVGCTAQGGLIDLHATLPGEEMARLTVATLRASGFEVVRDGETWLIRGSPGGDRRTGGYSGQAPADATAHEVQGANAFTIRTDGGTIARTALTASGQLDSRYIPGLEPDAAVALGEELGLALVGIERGEGSLLFGSTSDLETIESVHQRRPAVFTVAALGLSQDIVNAVADRNFVEVTRDDERDLLVVAGEPSSVRRAVAEIEALSGESRGYTVEAAFWRAEAGEVDRLGLSAGVALDFGEVALLAGLRSDASLSLVVDQLAEVTRSTATLRPAVSVAPGATASFSSGQEVPFQSGIDDEGTIDIEYRRVGSILDVHVVSLPGSMVRLHITIEVSTVDGTGLLGNPVFGSRVVETTVDMRRGQIVLLSGFDSEEATETRGFGLFLPNRNQSSATQSLTFVVAVD